jgi:hypothetical protein
MKKVKMLDTITHPKVSMTTKLYKPDDFMKALAEGSLVEPIIRVGMVKLDPNDQHAFLFSEGGSCGSWLKVPVEVVENIEFLGTRPCRDDEHPFVRVRLKDPPKDKTLATFFAGLARRVAPPRRPDLIGSIVRPTGPLLMRRKNLQVSPPIAQVGLSSSAAQLFGTWTWNGGGERSDCDFLGFGNQTLTFGTSTLNIFSDATYSFVQDYVQHGDFFDCKPFNGHIRVNIALNSTDGLRIALQTFVSPPIIEQQDDRQIWHSDLLGPAPFLAGELSRVFDKKHPPEFTFSIG